MLEFYQLLHKFRFDKFSSLSYFKIPPSHLFPPPPPAHPRPPHQFVIRLPRGPLLDFYSKRS